MDITTIAGILIGFTGIIIGYLLEHGVLSTLVLLPPICIVFGGAAGALLVSFPLSEVKKLPEAVMGVIKDVKSNEVDIIQQMAELSEKARKDGLLSLEQDAQSNGNEFIRKGLGLVVDGIETEVIKDILEREIELRERIHESGIKMFEAIGGYFPTMGVLGTVMGMVSILRDLSKPDELGGKISSAFIATMYGVGFANLIFLPAANKLRVKAEKEAMVNGLIVEGLLSIQAGENPKIIREKLNLALIEKMNGKKGAATEGKTRLEA
jgi:chemotaxis protein MotA